MRKTLRRIAALALAGAAAALPLAAQTPPEAPLRVFLRAGPKTHGEGEHDHPRFLEEWRELLAERGAQVDGALEFPTSAQLAATDVLVCYAAENGTLDAAQRADLMGFLERGGGIVVLHDAVCGDDAPWFQTVIGGAWEHGHSKWLEGRIGLYMADAEHPITRGIPHFELDDEIYHDLHLEPDVQVLGSSFRTVFDIEPQMWTYESKGYRAFVSLQGHRHDTFAHPAWRAIVLRGIAWAGGRDADLFLRSEELAGLRYPPGGPTPPQRAHEGFELHEGFEIQLAASEPDVENPISIDWDSHGRAWVACTPGYPHKQDFSGVPAHDRIVILEDGDGDGRLAPVSVFAEGLDLVSSVLVHEGGAIVSAAPEILQLLDRDGDDIADDVEVLYTGFGFGDTHAVVSNLRRGPDGWIYATQGYSGNASNDIVGKDGVSHGPIRNGVLRFRPDGSAIEQVSSYGSNTWGLDFSRTGELFFTMANGAHLRQVVVPEHVLALGRVGGATSWTDLPDHDRVAPIAGPGRLKNEQIDFVGGFTAASGCLILDSDLWPAEFQGNHFVCEPTVNLLHRDVLAPAGVTWSASLAGEREFLASRDDWFRPVHLRTGPDGALWLLDFYNQAVIHNDTRGPEHGPTNAAVRPDRDRDHGRLWRIVPRGAPASSAAIGADPRGWVADLERDGWRREHALRRLVEARDDTVLVELVAVAEGSSDDAAAIAALWVLGRGFEGPFARGTLRGALGHAREDVRAGAARVLAEIGVQDEGEVDALLALVRDPAAPRARLAALVALTRAELAPVHVESLVGAARALEDDWSRSALLAALAPTSTPALWSAGRRGEGELVDELVRQAARSRDGERIDGALAALAASTLAAPELARALGTLERELGTSFEPDAGGLGAASLRLLLERGELEVSVAALPLIGRWRAGTSLAREIERLGAELLVRLGDEDAAPMARLAALPALLSIPERREAAIGEAPALLASHQPLEVQLGAVEALGRLDDARAVELLCAELPRMGTRTRARTLELLLQSRVGATALLDGVARGDLSPRALGAREAHRLRTHPEAEIAARGRELLPTGSASTAERMAQLLPAVSARGDSERGREVFAAQCGTCHVYEGQGASVGPDLTGMGAHGVEALLGVILDPNAEIDPAYVEYVAETLDGRMSTGILVRETSDGIVLRNTGGDVEVARADLAELRSTGLSLMPSGLESMGADDLRHLLSFLTYDYQGWHALDLRDLANTSSLRGLFDREDDWSGWGRFTRHGVVAIEGVPFSLPDPELAAGGLNVLALRGGATQGWDCRTSYPQRVEIPVGESVVRVHVLGGVAGWGAPWGERSGEEAVRWTWVYADGVEETVVLRNGVEFADWIGRHDVPGSTAVEDLVAPGAPGQVRRFALAPAREVEVARIVLESPDNFVSPVFLALTAELPEARPVGAGPAPIPARPDVLILGGGTSHDFARWFDREDRTLLAEHGLSVRYTESVSEALAVLHQDCVLLFSTNQRLTAAFSEAVDRHVEAGGGVLFLHAGTWSNWPEWSTRAQRLLCAQASSHEDLGPFEVRRTDAEHPLARALPESFEITDELYRAEPVPGAQGLRVLAEGRSRAGDVAWPVLWTVEPGAGRVVGLTLGHDGDAHRHPAFRALLVAAVGWLRGPR
jgi:putative membrane-bound dehydrogenase-like protein